MVKIDYRSEKPIYEQIVEQIKLHVMKGELNTGDAIPSVRKMAQVLGVTPSTVAKAYQELERQKVIETIRAKGTFIARAKQMKLEEEAVDKMRKRIKSEILELKRNGYSEKQIVELVTEIYRSI